MAYTPGPWEKDRDGWIYGEEETVIWAEFDHNKQVAYVCIQEQDEPLILATPDLFAALEPFVKGIWAGVYHLAQHRGDAVLACRYCNGYSPDGQNIDTFRHDEACSIIKGRAAIARARGEGE